MVTLFDFRYSVKLLEDDLMKNFLAIFVLAVTLLLLPGPVQASRIQYEVTNVAGNTWEYTYTITNDSLLADIEEFAISFALGSYENLVVGSTLGGWDPLVIQPDPNLPDDGFYDVLALISGIAPGGTLGGFSVQFDYLGTGTPGSQPFRILDPNTFNVLDSGFTVSVAAPEPSVLGLFAVGLIGLAAVRGRRNLVSVYP